MIFSPQFSLTQEVAVKQISSNFGEIESHIFALYTGVTEEMRGALFIHFLGYFPII